MGTLSYIEMTANPNLFHLSVDPERLFVVRHTNVSRELCLTLWNEICRINVIEELVRRRRGTFLRLHDFTLNFFADALFRLLEIGFLREAALHNAFLKSIVSVGNDEAKRNDSSTRNEGSLP